MFSKIINKYFIYILFILGILTIYLIYINDLEKISYIIDLLPISNNIKKILISIIDLYRNKDVKIAKHKRSVTNLTKKMVASRQRWKCNICEILLDYSYQVDHITPLSRGGSNDIGNLQALCSNCHAKKSLSDYI